MTARRKQWTPGQLAGAAGGAALAGGALYAARGRMRPMWNRGRGLVKHLRSEANTKALRGKAKSVVTWMGHLGRTKK